QHASTGAKGIAPTRELSRLNEMRSVSNAQPQHSAAQRRATSDSADSVIGVLRCAQLVCTSREIAAQRDGIVAAQDFGERRHAALAANAVEDDRIERLLSIQRGAVAQIRRRRTRLALEPVAGEAIDVVV